MKIAQFRQDYHNAIAKDILRLITTPKPPGYYPSFSDKDNESSVRIGNGLVKKLGFSLEQGKTKGQSTGSHFERLTRQFLTNCFELLQHVRPGNWAYTTQGHIGYYEQYAHLAHLQEVVKKDRKLKAALGGDYLVGPDILIGRKPLTDEELNKFDDIVGSNDGMALHAPLRIATANREGNSEPRHILHASISCKWTLRSDRAQNARTEALNLIRNRKGNLPHIVAVTAEPLPTRLAALALGTGDLDCVYHIALAELEASIRELMIPDQLDMLETLVGGRRLRDISDLPFDLAI